MKENKTTLGSGEKKLIRQAQEGSQSAFSQLLKANECFLRKLTSPKHLAKETDLTAFDFQFYSEDLLQVAKEEFIQAIRSFDLTKATTLRTYSFWRISHVLRNSVKQWVYHTTGEVQDYYSQFESSTDIVQSIEFVEIANLDLTNRKDLELEVINNQELLEKAYEQLTSREAEIFQLHLHLNMKGKDIANRLKLSPAMVSKTLTKTKAKLKRYFKN